MFKLVSTLFLTLILSASLVGYAGGKEGDPLGSDSGARASASAGIAAQVPANPTSVSEPVANEPAADLRPPQLDPAGTIPGAPVQPPAPKPPEPKPEAPYQAPVANPAGLSYEMAITKLYGQVTVGGAGIYENPGDAAAGIGPKRWVSAGYSFVSLASLEPVEVNGEKWYPVNGGGYVSAKRVTTYSPSRFHGVEVTAQPEKPFAWLVRDEKPSLAPGGAPAKDAAVIKRYTIVSLLEKKQVANWTWYRVGEKQWLPQYRLGIVFGAKAPEGVGPDEKWIEVNLTEQTLAAYEGSQMKFATLVSSGLPQWPTAPGLFRIWTKVQLDEMSGRAGLPDYYYLEDIPWIMYFNKDTALHTAYWHDDFGFQHSHGCVNLAPQDALWLFRWTTPAKQTGNWTFPTKDDPGTWVWVHY